MTDFQKGIFVIIGASILSFLMGASATISGNLTVIVFVSMQFVLIGIILGSSGEARK